MDLTDTIAAIASGNQPAARGAIRISGPRAMDCVEKCFETSGGLRPRDLKHAVALEGRFDLPVPFSYIECRVYCWPDNRSYTQQPSAEFHMIGSPPILNAALKQVCQCGARMAEPGEFTMRAFLAGRLDLTQAEAVLGVIDARDQQELDVALTQLSGGLAGPLADLRSELIELLAHLEAGLDFVEEDIEFVSIEELDRSLASILKRIEELQKRITTRQHHDQLPTVVLYGWPNAGKSSLFNALGNSAKSGSAESGSAKSGSAKSGSNESTDDSEKSTQAIVSDISGTTRDWLQQRITIDDTAIRLIDTAGIEDTSGETTIMAAAQELNATARQRADLKLLCIDSSRDLNRWEMQQLDQLSNDHHSPVVVVLTKSDLSVSSAHPTVVNPELTRAAMAVVHTSSTSGEGLGGLGELIANCVANTNKSSDVVVSETAQRSSDSIRLAAESIERALDVNRTGLGEELVAAELRIALEQLGRVVGAICTDDILDQVFSRFCIGK